MLIGDSKNPKETTVTTTNTTFTATAATTTVSTTGSHGGYTSGSGTPGSISTGNHLDVPQQSNPNLLSPDTLQQRRGK